MGLEWNNTGGGGIPINSFPLPHTFPTEFYLLINQWFYYAIKTYHQRLEVHTVELFIDGV